MSKSTISSCLRDIGVDTSILKTLTRIEDEFALIKKTYFKKIILVHPDKGGDATMFRKVNEAFEALREIYEKKSLSSFVSSLGKNAEAKVKNLSRSWDYYNDAFDVAVPIYKVELAKSGRSKCTQKTKSAKKCTSEEIEKGDVRVGSIDLESGSYTRWLHLTCWRVASKIWLGLPNPDVCQDKSKFEEALSSMNEVLFTGFDSLDPADKSRIIDHVMDKSHWAKLTHRSGPPVVEDTKIENSVKKEIIGALPAPDSSQDQNQLVLLKKELDIVKPFKMPVKTSQNENYLNGKTVVLTGVFPEAGGGAGLNLGKDKVKSMIADFGGRITSAISGKTDMLIVGKDPGFSKVSKARSQPKCQLITLDRLTNAIESGKSESLEKLPPVLIDSFSSGYYGTSTLALEASTRELEIAKGLVEPPLQILPNKRSQETSSAVVKKPRVTKKRKADVEKKAEIIKETDIVDVKKTTVAKKDKKVTVKKTEGVEISGLKEKEAIEFLSSKNWDLEVSINEFLNSENIRRRRNPESRAAKEPQDSKKKGPDTVNTRESQSGGWIMQLLRKGIDSLFWIVKWSITLLLGNYEIKRISGMEFLENYEVEYGKVHPQFFPGNYSQALENGKRETKWVLIALYMKDHPGNKEFCKNIISSSQLSSFIREKKGIFWMGDTRTEEGLQVIDVLSVKKHPFLAVVAPQNSKMVVFDRIQGDFSIQETLYRLSQIITRVEPFLKGIREERVTRQTDRSIREQQDEAYQASLKADQEKERLAKIQKEEKEKNERIALEKEQEILQKLEEKKKRRQELIKNLPQEPQDSKENITKLSIRLPSGQRIVRRFEVTSTIRQLYEFVETQELTPLSIECDFVLVKTFPRVILQDLDSTLESCRLLPTGSLIVEEKI